MPKVIKNVTEEAIGPVAFGDSRVVFEPGEVKTVDDEFPETPGLEEFEGEEDSEAEETEEQNKSEGGPEEETSEEETPAKSRSEQRRIAVQKAGKGKKSK